MRSLELGKSASKDKNRAVVVRGFGRANSPFNKLFYQRYKFYATMHWYSYVGWTWPTPVCDGTWLYVHMNQGQVARLSLADGSIDWFRRLGEFGTGWDRYSKQPTPRSPLLHKGVMIISTSPGLFGLDGKTGKELWRHELPEMTNVTALGPKLMHLPSGRTVLASYTRARARSSCSTPPTASCWERSRRRREGRPRPGPQPDERGRHIISSYTAQAFRVTEEGETLGVKELWPRKRGPRRQYGGPPRRLLL